MSRASSRWPKLREPPSWSGLSVEDRARAIESACRTAMELLRNSSNREARLRHVDPVPASTRALLRRLAARQDA